MMPLLVPPAPPPPPAPAADPESLWAIFLPAGVRNYLITGLAALAMLFVVLAARGSDLGGLLLGLTGAGGMVFRRAAAPAMVLLGLVYFLMFPDGVPPAWENQFEIGNNFRATDIVLVAAVLVYLMAHYRVFGLTAQAVPFDGRHPRKGEKPARRPPAIVRPGEITALVSLVAAVVVAGQIGWWAATNVEPDPDADFGLVVVRQPAGRGPAGRYMRPGLARFVVLAGGVGAGALLARLVFGYWRLRAMSAAEAAMILQDAEWNETRREPSRLEVWRAWRRARAEARRPPPPRVRPIQGGGR